MLQQRSRDQNQYPSVHVLDIGFLHLLLGKDPSHLQAGDRLYFDQIRKHTGDTRRRRSVMIDIFLKEYVFIPVHSGVSQGTPNGTHWSLCVIDNRAKKILYYDSLPGQVPGKLLMKQVKQYLVLEQKDKNLSPVDVNEYSESIMVSPFFIKCFAWVMLLIPHYP